MISHSPGRLIVWSPRKRRLAILRRYQALGKARISLSRLMSYLNEAEPMSHTAKRRMIPLVIYYGSLRYMCTSVADLSENNPQNLISPSTQWTTIWFQTLPEMLMRVVSILPPLPGMKLSMKVGPPVRLILDKLTFTNSRLILRESFRPVTEDGSSSTVP